MCMPQTGRNFSRLWGFTSSVWKLFQYFTTWAKGVTQPWTVSVQWHHWNVGAFLGKASHHTCSAAARLECFYHPLCLPSPTEVSSSCSLGVGITKVWQSKGLQRSWPAASWCYRYVYLSWAEIMLFAGILFWLFTISDQRERIIRWRANFHL